MEILPTPVVATILVRPATEKPEVSHQHHKSPPPHFPQPSPLATPTARPQS